LNKITPYDEPMKVGGNKAAGRLIKIIKIRFRFRYKFYLIVEVPRPGGSEVNFSVFESNCYLLQPV